MLSQLFFFHNPIVKGWIGINACVRLCLEMTSIISLAEKLEHIQPTVTIKVAILKIIQRITVYRTRGPALVTTAIFILNKNAYDLNSYFKSVIVSRCHRELYLHACRVLATIISDQIQSISPVHLDSSSLTWLCLC